MQESRERVRAAIVNSHFEFPSRRITVNLAPADLRKEGPSFDLPIALALPARHGAGARRLGGAWPAGGRRRARARRLGATRWPARWPWPRACGAGVRGLLAPAANAAEASLVDGLEVYPAATLRRPWPASRRAAAKRNRPPTSPRMLRRGTAADADFADIIGQATVKRVLGDRRGRRATTCS